MWKSIYHTTAWAEEELKIFNRNNSPGARNMIWLSLGVSLTKLVENRDFQFWKSKILLSCYTPSNSKLFLLTL